MMNSINFKKYHGLGNDYLFLDAIADPSILELNFPTLSRVMSNRRLGPGSDGIVVISSSHTADFKMRIFNPDGSEAESCGNALRCLGRICRENGYSRNETFTIETLGGHVTVYMDKDDTQFNNIGIRMGIPRWESDIVPVNWDQDTLHVTVRLAEVDYDAACLNVGNPHCVLFLNTVSHQEVVSKGPLIENLPLFPDRINVGFCSVENRSLINLTVWERGAGLTGACGTGATAAFAAAFKRQLVDTRCDVKMPGGILHFEMLSDGAVQMTGPATYVYSGRFPADEFRTRR